MESHYKYGLVILACLLLIYGCIGGQPKAYLKAYMPVGPAIVEGGIEGTINPGEFNNAVKTLSDQKRTCVDSKLCLLLVEMPIQSFPGTKKDVMIEIAYPKDTLNGLRLADESKYVLNATTESGDTNVKLYQYGTKGEMVSEGVVTLYLLSEARQFGSMDVSKAYNFTVKIYNSEGTIVEGAFGSEFNNG